MVMFLEHDHLFEFEAAREYSLAQYVRVSIVSDRRLNFRFLKSSGSQFAEERSIRKGVQRKPSSSSGDVPRVHLDSGFGAVQQWCSDKRS